MLETQFLRRRAIIRRTQNLRLKLEDALIGVRELLLNAVVGAGSIAAINSKLPDLPMDDSENIASQLKQALDEIMASVSNESGTAIDYLALRQNDAYSIYKQECLAALKTYDPRSIKSEESRRAFWINLYNALVLDAILMFNVTSSVDEGPLGLVAFFRRAAYVVNGRKISLEDIEHGILRSNNGNPYILGKHFPSNDPRVEWVLPLDPRIHFALNCGGRACPPIQSYSGENLNHQLDLATKSFLATSVEVDEKRNEITVSKILKWYADDFGGKDGIIDFLINHLPTEEHQRFISDNRQRLNIRYAGYDWALNAL